MTNVASTERCVPRLRSSVKLFPIQAWNALPVDIAMSPSVDTFNVRFQITSGPISIRKAFSRFKGTSVIICDCTKPKSLLDAVHGKEIGTFFRPATSADSSKSNFGAGVGNAKHLALSARQAGRGLRQATGEQRAAAIERLADLLLQSQAEILEANRKDLREAQKNGKKADALDFYLNNFSLLALFGGNGNQEEHSLLARISGCLFDISGQ
ncbi:unnamed protein product [Dibothriocephalus latus]|uniref:Aldehyde dehydrogenase domain-containing protein n=1 Tax=Dibothriocephalus latus TaxID=60516 RepID=A0A3P7MF44_DIBLA|nr:unnamed protein product [Dibothriocephalus latus]